MLVVHLGAGELREPSCFLISCHKHLWGGVVFCSYFLFYNFSKYMAPGRWPGSPSEDAVSWYLGILALEQVSRLKPGRPCDLGATVKIEQVIRGVF